MIAAAAAPPPAIVAPAAEDQCLTYDDHYDVAPLMVVRPGGQVHLQDQARPCDHGSACTFVRKAYLVPGDVVLASAPLHDYRCVYVGSNGRLSAGFVPDAALAPALEDGAPLSADFLAGHWRDGDDNLSFTRAGTRLTVEGDAIWPGREPGQRPDGSPISPHTGDVSGPVRLAGDRFDVGSEQDCHVWGRRRGPYLVVEDNGSCGGMNVRFMGLYVKAAH